MPNLQEIINNAVSFIHSKTDFIPEIGLVLGSGLGNYVDCIENPIYIDYHDIPDFPQSTVHGHVGRFVLGTRFGKNVIAMQGRFHSYEGYKHDVLTIPIRVMAKLGVKNLLLTNAAGGVNPTFKEGCLMLLTDHINLSGQNPLIGPNLDEFGPRFPDMTEVYSLTYRNQLKKCVQKENIELEEGVYMMMSGPTYETPAEVRMAHVLGADAVGMSTVPEAIVARHSGMNVLGVSCITNLAAGVADHTLNHEEVIEVTTRVRATFTKLVDCIIKDVF